MDKQSVTCTDALYGDGLGPFSIQTERLLGRIERGVEKGVDQGGLAQARLAYER